MLLLLLLHHLRIEQCGKSVEAEKHTEKSIRDT
jgi:hypothetical protein